MERNTREKKRKEEKGQKKPFCLRNFYLHCPNCFLHPSLFFIIKFSKLPFLLFSPHPLSHLLPSPSLRYRLVSFPPQHRPSLGLVSFPLFGTGPVPPPSALAPPPIPFGQTKSNRGPLFNPFWLNKGHYVRPDRLDRTEAIRPNITERRPFVRPYLAEWCREGTGGRREPVPRSGEEMEAKEVTERGPMLRSRRSAEEGRGNGRWGAPRREKEAVPKRRRGMEKGAVPERRRGG